MVDFQARALRELLVHATTRVSFYRRWWAGVALDGVRTVDDLAALPLLGKRDLRLAPLADRLAGGRRPGGLVHYATSGSTGEPFEVYRGQREDLLLSAFLWRAWRSLGVKTGDRRIFVATERVRQRGRLARYSRGLRHRIVRRVSCAQPIDGVVADVRRLRPDVLHSYPSVLAMMAARNGGDARRRIGPRLVITGGEVLTAADRETIGAGFSATVRDVYAAHEGLALAWECAATGLYHVCDDSVVLEVLGAGGGPAREGEEGDVVITALHSRVMPFIRYRLGDRAVRGPTPCPCGLPFSTLAAIRGRRVDYYTLPDGRVIHHYDLLIPALVRSGVRELIDRLQFVQERTDLFRLRIAPWRDEDRAAIGRFGAEILHGLGPGVEVLTEFVARTDFDPAGKFRLGTSNVTRDA